MTLKQVTKKDEADLIRDYNFRRYLPEQWVARFGHRIMSGDLRRYTFENKDFEKWIHEVYRILHTENLELLRQNLLTINEIEKIEKEMKADF